MQTDRRVVTGSKLYINMNTGDILKTVTDVNIVQTTLIISCDTWTTVHYFSIILSGFQSRLSIIASLSNAIPLTVDKTTERR